MPVETVTEAKAQLSALIERVIAGEEILIGRYGKAEVKLVRAELPGPRVPGDLKGKIRMADDFDEFGPELQEMFKDYLP